MIISSQLVFICIVRKKGCVGGVVVVTRWRIYGVDGVVLLGEWWWWWGAWLLICLLH